MLPFLSWWEQEKYGNHNKGEWWKHSQMITRIGSINTTITWLLWHLISGQREDPWRQETKNTCISNVGTPKPCGYLIYQQAHILQQRQGIPLYAFRQHYWTEPSSSTAVVSSPLCTWLATFQLTCTTPWSWSLQENYSQNNKHKASLLPSGKTFQIIC